MAFTKIIGLIVSLSIVSIHCGLLPAHHFQAAPLAAVAPVAPVLNTDYDPSPQYTYAYNIQDAITGDSKSQQETRDGDVVKGSYSLVEPDGNIRTVIYTADPINGFNAVVQRAPLVHQKIVAPVPVGVASPFGRIIG